jgi:polyisoprenoid-binding protein YceI
MFKAITYFGLNHFNVKSITASFTRKYDKVNYDEIAVRFY